MSGWAQTPPFSDSTALANRVPLTVVGIAPAPFLGCVRGEEADVWIPLSMYPSVRFAGVSRLPSGMPPSEIFADPASQLMGLVGRLAPEVPLAQATTTLGRIAAGLSSLEATGQQDRRTSAALVARGLGSRTGVLTHPLAATSAAVGLLLLLACANVANMLFARELSRAREHAIRLSLGASRLRLASGLLAEHAVLVAAGGAIGLAGARLLVSLMPALQVGAADVLRMTARIDLRVAAMACALVAATLVLSGLLPALRASCGAVAPALLGYGASSARRWPRVRLRSLLVVTQVAISVVLLIGAGILGRSLLNLSAVPLGFDTRQTLVASINMTGHVDSPSAGAAFTRMLLARLAAVPGVEAASLAHAAPIERRTSSFGGFLPDGRSDTPARGFLLTLNVVSPDYFRALGIPIRRGRVFSDHDPPGLSAGIVINESAARAYWPGRDALGQRLKRRATPGREAMALEVIGIVADSRYANIDQPIAPIAYFLTEHPVTRQVMPEQWIVIRAAGDPMDALPELQAVVRTIDPTMALLEPMRMSERVARVTSVQRTIAAVAAMFGLFALILAAVGVYGVLTQVVLERTREIGVRMALGARRQQVLLMVARSAGRLVVAGIAAGLGMAAGAGRFVASLLFGVTPADPFTFAAVACGLGAAAMAAAFIPARRAASVDPAASLKAD